MDFELKDKWAWVSGGTAGIGFAIAEQLVKAGANVVVVGRDFTRLENAVKRLKRLDPSRHVEGKHFDLQDVKLLTKNIEDVLSKHGIDILIHNVGGPAAGNTMEITLENWDKGYTSLLRGPVMFNQMVIPAMMKKKWGRILNITSTAAVEIIPKLPVSATFRSGLSAYVKILAKEVGRSGVLVNNLLPGPTNTERLQELKTKSPAFFESMATETAVGRIAEPDEIAKAAVFLCSGANTYITGTDVLVDGGYTKAL